MPEFALDANVRSLARRMGEDIFRIDAQTAGVAQAADRAVAAAGIAEGSEAAAALAAGQVQEAVGLATQAAQVAVPAAETATTQAGVAVAAADRIGDLDQGTELLNGGAVAVSMQDESGQNAGDLIRVYPDGLDMIPSAQMIARFPVSIAESEELADASIAVLTLDDGDGNPQGDLIRAYSDGLDFIPSARLVDRLGGGGGGGEEADGWAAANSHVTAHAGQNGVNTVERILIRGDGVRLPVPVVDGVQRRASIDSSYGQSNANVTRLLDDLMWDTPPLPYHAFMLDDMNAITAGNLRGGMMGWQGVAVQRGSRMINASEALRDTQDYASVAFATEARLQPGTLRRVSLIRSSAWGGNRLVGTAPAQGIWQDSVGAYTQSYLNWRGDLLQSYELMTEAGYLVDQVNIHFTHQEADWQTTRALYLSQFLGMKADIEAWIAANLPGVTVEWFVDQASGSGLRTGSYQGGLWPSRMAIYDATLPSNGGENITMVMPRYWLTFGTTMAGAQEDIHHSYRSRIWQGEVYGYARKEKRAGRPWRCPVMTSASVSGNEVVVNFDSLQPLVIDMAFCKVRPDAGFVVGNGAQVTGVRLTGQRQVTVTCATAPATSISYAYRAFDGQDVLDEWPLSTGAIRDAWETPSLFDPGKKLVRAALGYQLPL